MIYYIFNVNDSGATQKGVMRIHILKRFYKKSLVEDIDRSRKKWIENLIENLKKMGVRTWKRRVYYKKVCLAFIVGLALVLQGHKNLWLWI